MANPSLSQTLDTLYTFMALMGLLFTLLTSITIYVISNIKRDLKVAWRADIEELNQKRSESDQRLHRRIDEIAREHSDAIHDLDTRVRVLESSNPGIAEKVNSLQSDVRDISRQLNEMFEKIIDYVMRRGKYEKRRNSDEG